MDATLQLSPKLAGVLRSLAVAGAATPTQLEVRSGMIGEDVEAELRTLHEMGFVDSRATTGGVERELFFPSRLGLEYVR